jgi:hypothetical protein
MSPERESIEAENRHYHLIANRLYAIGAAVCAAAMVQQHMTPDIIAAAFTAIVGVLIFAAAIKLEELVVTLFRRSLERWSVGEFVFDLLGTPFGRAALAFSIAASAIKFGSGMQIIALLVFGMMFAYLQWSDWKERNAAY